MKESLETAHFRSVNGLRWMILCLHLVIFLLSVVVVGLTVWIIALALGVCWSYFRFAGVLKKMMRIESLQWNRDQFYIIESGVKRLAVVRDARIYSPKFLSMSIQVLGASQHYLVIAMTGLLDDQDLRKLRQLILRHR